jgi:hypothetical protein
MYVRDITRTGPTITLSSATRYYHLYFIHIGHGLCIAAIDALVVPSAWRCTDEYEALLQTSMAGKIEILQE